MGFYGSVLEVLDTSSFSSIWYWIAVAVMWSLVSHFALGVPYDIVRRARSEPAAQRDMADIVRVNINRLIALDERAALGATAVLAASLTMLALVGFAYGSEMAQAVFFLVFPLSLVLTLSIRRARRISAEAAEGDALRRHLLAHRRVVQLVGMVSLFVTALYGMFHNFAVGPFG